MKLFEIREVRYGEKLPEAWISKAILNDGRGYIFSIMLPLFSHQTRPCEYSFQDHTGWYVPRIMLGKVRDRWRFRMMFFFHSASLDEEWSDYEGFGSGQDKVVNA